MSKKLYVVTQTTKAIVWGSYGAEAERALQKAVEIGEASHETTSISEELKDITQLPAGWSTGAYPYGDGPEEITVGAYLKVPITLHVEIRPWLREQVEAFVKKIGGEVTGDE